ncbi:XRE family transcriptional regulator [bacterium]|nr:MAG: XRE family transcriptional regulator [bacterium]
MPATATARPIGEHLRDWRTRRRLSQLELAYDTEISPRHLSFVETGRSTPSREMILRLAEQLEVPLRDRNTLLLAGGYAPIYDQRSLDDPAMKHVREAIDLVLKGHEPYPALALDRHWNLMAANRAVAPLLAGVSSALREPVTNVIRLSLHPEGLASRIVNLSEWRAHLIGRLRHQAETTGDPILADLLTEVAAYPAADGGIEEANDVAVPLRLRTEAGVLSFISTTTVFGTPLDVTLSELALESFFPADAATAEALRRLG